MVGGTTSTGLRSEGGWRIVRKEAAGGAEKGPHRLRLWKGGWGLSVSEPCRELTDEGKWKPSHISGVSVTGKMMVTGLSGCSGDRDRWMNLRTEATGLFRDWLQGLVKKLSLRYIYNPDLYTNASDEYKGCILTACTSPLHVKMHSALIRIHLSFSNTDPPYHL